MNELYTCECRDGRTITGCSRWSLYELRRLSPLELAKVLEELLNFSRYYESVFYYPTLSLQEEIQRLIQRYQTARRLASACGAVTGGLVVIWLVLVVLPSLRFSGLTLLLAVLIIISILVLIPLLFRFVSTQEDYGKRLPRARVKLDKLIQKEEKEIYGEYLEYLISAYLISPEFGLSADALALMVEALRTKRAGNLSEALLLCKKKFGSSPIPRIITSLHSVSAPAQSSNANPKKVSLNQIQSQPPDMQVILQLCGYLQSALQGYAASQKTASVGPDSVTSTLTYEEETLIEEYRCLQDDEKKRIRRVVHSFRTRKY